MAGEGGNGRCAWAAPKPIKPQQKRGQPRRRRVGGSLRRHQLQESHHFLPKSTTGGLEMAASFCTEKFALGL